MKTWVQASPAKVHIHAEDRPARWSRFIASLAVIATITAADIILPHLNQTTITLTHLMGVLGIAARWGLLEAMLASVAAIACEAFFFLPPLYDFAIADSQNWVAVTAFFVVSIVAGQLSAGARNRAREAIARQRELEMLYTLSQAMMEADTAVAPGQSIVDLTRNLCGMEACVFREAQTGAVFHSGTWEIIPESQLLPVEAGGEVFGSMGWLGPPFSPQAQQSIAHLAGISLDRARTQQAATRAEAARQGQQLKSLLMDAVAHDFKTPLTSIKFGATVLKDDAELKPAHRELVTVIDEEADRLDRIVWEAIQTARLEAGNLQLQLEAHTVASLVRHAQERLRSRWEDRQIAVSLAADLPRVRADAGLVSIAIAHLIDNAFKYSPEDAKVEIETRRVDGDVEIAVCDRGPGIPESEHRRIFERFYRRPQGSDMPGAGTGLTIALEVLRLHGEDLTVENRAGGGACFRMKFPIAGESASV